MKDVTRFSFSAKALKRIHSTHRGFLIAGCAAINDINSSMFLVLSLRKGSLNEAERAFISNYICTLLAIQSTKIHEYIRVASEYKRHLLSSHPAMGSRIETDLAGIEEKLKSREYKWIEMLRHKVASHLDVGFAVKELDRIDDDTILNFYVSERKFETAYDFATDIFYKRIFAGIDGGFEAAASHLLRFVGQISDFHNGLVLEIFKHNGMMSEKAGLFISKEHLLPLQSGVLPVLYGDALKSAGKSDQGSL